MNQSELKANTCRPLPSAGKGVRVSLDWFWFYSWLVEKVARDFLAKSQTVAMQNQSNCIIIFDTQLKTALFNDQFKKLYQTLKRLLHHLHLNWEKKNWLHLVSSTHFSVFGNPDESPILMYYLSTFNYSSVVQ